MQFTKPQIIAAALLMLACVVAAGCMKGPTVTVHEFMMEYEPPQPPEGPKLNAGLNMAAFTATAGYSDTAMVYRSKDYQRAEFNYARWRVPPAQMVYDYLVRDFRAAGVFDVILPEDQGTTSRFRLNGSVEQFLANEVGGNSAELELLITLVDTAHSRLPRRIVYQKRYKASSSMDGKKAGNIASAMSRAMRQVSGQVISDAYNGAAKRLAQGEPEE